MIPNAHVIVCRQPSSHEKATYLLSAFENPHWDTISGGIQTTMFNQPFIYGYVQCTGAVKGEVAHSGVHGRCPHRIKVCALKQDNDEAVYNTLLKMAGPRPKANRAKPSTGRFCKEDILLILTDKKEMRRAVLIKELLDIGHGENNIIAIIKKLAKEDRILYVQDPDDKRFKYCKIK